jgi:hypothetical protein
MTKKLLTVLCIVLGSWLVMSILLIVIGTRWQASADEKINPHKLIYTDIGTYRHGDKFPVSGSVICTVVDG